MQRGVLVLVIPALVATLPATGCAPAIAGGLIVAGGASLYEAKLVHVDCKGGKMDPIPCAWNEMLFTGPLFTLGVILSAVGVGAGAYAVVHDH